VTVRAPSSALDEGRVILRTAPIGRQIIIRGPVDQAAERLGEGRHVVELKERTEPVVANLLRFQPLSIPDDADLLPRSERCDHD
jgi:hypothetical protein